MCTTLFGINALEEKAKVVVVVVVVVAAAAAAVVAYESKLFRKN